jgi:hypothetical protein
MGRAGETFGGITLMAFGPLVIARFDSGWTTDDLGEVMERILTLAPLRFAVVSEMRKAKPAGARERKVISERLARIEAEVNERVVVSAVIADSMLTRGAIRAVRWLRPTRYPVLTFEHLGSAIHECIARLAEEGIELAEEDASEATAFATRTERERLG